MVPRYWSSWSSDKSNTKTFVVYLKPSRTDYCNSLLAGLAQSLVGKLQKVQNCADIFTGCLSEPEFPIRLHAPVSTLSPPPPLPISLNSYIRTTLLDLFAPVLTPASSKFHSISARQKVYVLSLTSVLLSGTHCHCTLEIYNYRHLQVCSKNLSLQHPRI